MTRLSVARVVVTAALLAAGLACNRVPAPRKCLPGNEGCACDVDSRCYPAGGQALTCDRGYCVPQACARGTEGCACYANGSCDALQGIPMTCAANLCVRSPATTPGELGGSCSATAPCRSGGVEALACVSGRCEVAGCPSGTVGCPCGAYGACEAFAGEDVRCNDGMCVLGSCLNGGDGRMGCNCRTDATCDGDLRCVRDVCRGRGVRQLLVGNPEVRSCDVLVRESGPRVGRVVFAGQARGSHFARSPEVGVSFMATLDQPFSGPVVTLEGETDSAVADFNVRLGTTRCGDRLGQPVADPRLSVQ
ncbi:MAG: hypothetical protein HY904_00745 [Deltaproteobacteria bacterium]|nr:hypothetical protein [Deltaproteobacteria bacterium]